MSMFLTGYVARTSQHTLTLLDQAAAVVVIDTVTPDILRFRIFRTGGATLFEVSTSAPTAGGSSLSLANPTTLILDEDDLDFAPGAYDCEAMLIDGSDGSRVKHADTGIFVLHSSSL